MNLRKALDKAKQERQQASQGEVAPVGLGGRPEIVREGRFSPDYSQSRYVALDVKRLEKSRCVCLIPDSREMDRYKVIRTQIAQRMRANGWNTLMITSALPGEGKSLTAINLAATFAKEVNQTVLLVDADLRLQKIHRYLGYESKVGLVDYLVDDYPLKEMVVWPGIEKLTIISGGRTIQDSTELLGSPKMISLMREMKSRYKERFILLESPPIHGCPDTLAFAPLVDAIVMVVESGRTSVDEVKKALEMIPKEKFLGFILNRHTSTMKDYGSYYSYDASSR
jgi:non-specific protein-tyrosine kinase